MKSHCPRSYRSTGFTLIELLVVIAIMALAVTVIPRAMTGLPASHLRAVAHATVIAMRKARDVALHQGAIVDFELNLELPSFRVSGEPAPHPFPGVVEKVTLQTLSVQREDVHPRIRFFPDGSATQATLTFRHGTLEAHVVVDGLTGAVHQP